MQVDIMDSGKYIYEDNELQELDEVTNGFKPAPFNNSNKLQDKSSFLSSGKLPTAILFAVQLVTLAVLVLLLVITGVVLSRLNTLPVCENSQNTSSTNATTAGYTGPSPTCTNNNTSTNTTVNVNTSCNCLADSMWTDQQIQQLLNTSRDTASKIDGVVAYTEKDSISTQNITAQLVTIFQNTAYSVQTLSNMVETLANLRDTGIYTAEAVNDVLTAAVELLRLQNSSLALNLTEPTSCRIIKTIQPNSTSGFYNLNGQSVYCNMDTLCGSGGGWTRLAYLDMSDSSQNCPTGFRLYQSGGVRACGRPVTGIASCQSLLIPSDGIRYTEICGRVEGYQYGSTDAVHPTDGPFGHQNNINSYYADGVSITRGNPRQHVWTFIAGYTEVADINSNSNCPCSTGNTVTVPSFVGNNYYCESGNPNSDNSVELYSADPLWDDSNCGVLERDCCLAPDLPWFHRDYGSASTTDDLEMRICGDEATSNEDCPVGYYEIYVK